MNSYKKIDIDKIKPDPNQPRKTFKKDIIDGMADSIIAEGVINPIEIDKDFMIVTGETRWRAAKEAGLKEIPCKIIEVKDKNERFARQMIENLHHGAMTAWDVAMGFRKMADDNKSLIHPDSGQIKTERNPKGSGQYATGVKWLSLRTGITKQTISAYLSLLGEDEAVKKALSKDEIKWTSVDEIKKAPKEHQKELKKRLVRGELKDAGAHGMRAIAKALRTRPEEAKQLLKQDFTGKKTAEVRDAIQEVIPDYTETPLTDAFIDASKVHIEITSAAARITRVLKDNPKDNVMKGKLPQVISSLLIANSAINRYLGKDKNIIENEIFDSP